MAGRGLSTLPPSTRFIPMRILRWMASLLGRPRPAQAQLDHESEFVVTFDGEKILCRRPEGAEETVRWNELGTVLVETNDLGPAAADVFWFLISQDKKSGCAFPPGATGDSELIKRLQELPGFDNEAVITAMTSAENQHFLCWQADSEG